MVNEYRLGQNNRVNVADMDWDNYNDSVVWIDAFFPGEEDLGRLNRMVGFEVPTRHDIMEIELSNRFYKEKDCYIMIANLLPRSETEVLPPRPVAFILRKNLLLTIRFCHFFSFDRVSSGLPVNPEPQSPLTVFNSLLDAAVSDRADNLEHSMRRMEDLTSRLFMSPTDANNGMKLKGPELDEALRLIGVMGERMANIRESIASLQRALNFAQTYLPPDWLSGEKAIMSSMKTDLTAMSDEAAFFMNKLSFNLDATLGMINIEETKIIRVLSVVTLVLSPPMVIGAIYGMNFANMPELHWPYGYWFSLGLMGVTALLPLWYLKKKKWL